MNSGEETTKPIAEIGVKKGEENIHTHTHICTHKHIHTYRFPLIYDRVVYK